MRIEPSLKDIWLLRIGAAAYFSVISMLALFRFSMTALGRQVSGDLSVVNIATFAFLCITSWSLIVVLIRRSDQVAAVLYGLFYAGRIGDHLLQGRGLLVVRGLECVIIVGGLIAVMRGIVKARSNGLYATR